MARIDALVQDFLAQKRIAIVGVSDNRPTGCNLSYRKFKQAGYTVFAVNPHLKTYDGDPCYPDLKSLPEKPDAVFLFTNPKVTEQVTQECVDLGVPRVWMHCMTGTIPGSMAKQTSVSQRAVNLCRQHGISVIPGACPNQFLKPDFAHAAMRVLFRTVGMHSVPDPV